MVGWLVGEPCEWAKGVSITPNIAFPIISFTRSVRMKEIKIVISDTAPKCARLLFIICASARLHNNKTLLADRKGKFQNSKEFIRSFNEVR
jgi:hypothetical protein